MKNVISLFLTLILSSIAFLHFHWAAGGTWGWEHALPSNEAGQLLLNPSALDCIIVGIGLLGFGVFYLFKSDVVHLSLPVRLSNVLSWIIPMIFLLRAIGDFKYVGFFKEVSQTTFGQADSLYFSPLCLLIGFLGLIMTRLK